MKENRREIVDTILTSLFQRLGKGFIPVTQLPHRLTAEERNRLGLKKKKKYAQKDVLKSLEPLPAPFQMCKKGQSYFILDKSPQNLILEQVARKPGKSVSEIAARHFPFKLDVVINEANNLIKQGIMMALIRPTKIVELHLSPKAASGNERQTVTGDPVLAFKDAYDKVGSGRRFVDIYKIRRHLNWSRQQFDSVMDQLMSDGFITANLGNPGELTDDEVRDSFQDDYGDLYITVTWRKNHGN